jgi:tetratricopeptide (TPR) repeat protein
MKNKKRYVISCLALAFFVSCSSAPKRPAEVFVIQTMTETQLEIANQEADRGNFTVALPLLEEAWRLAVSTDRPNLRVRVAISRANTLFYLGRQAEAQAMWQSAEEEATAAGDAPLAGACRIYQNRSRLTGDAEIAADVLAKTEADYKIVKSDKLFAALAWTVIGLAQKDLEQFETAEKSILNALDIHEDDNYLEHAGYDWYLIGSVRSVAGNFAGAQTALDNALGFDRRAENTFALGMDWAAKGDVFKKTGDDESAVYAWSRAAEIFRTLALEDQAREVESRING